MSLVASYTDSEDEDDFRAKSSSEIQEDKSKEVEMPIISKQSIKTPLNNLFGGSSLSTDEDSSDSEENGEKRRKKPKPSSQQLDNPFRYFGSGNVSAQDSVLRVEFREEEAHKTAVLERHVKMTETAGVAMTIGGKKICWNHRKGKCRFGHNCKFAHDSDILTNADGTPNHPEKNFNPTSSSSEEPLNNPPPFLIKRIPAKVRLDDSDPTTPVVFASSAHLSGDNGGNAKRKKSDDLSDEEIDDSKKGGKDKRKKRPGLTPGLVPGKKAMNMYYKSKDT